MQRTSNFILNVSSTLFFSKCSWMFLCVCSGTLAVSRFMQIQCRDYFVFCEFCFFLSISFPWLARFFFYFFIFGGAIARCFSTPVGYPCCLSRLNWIWPNVCAMAAAVNILDAKAIKIDSNKAPLGPTSPLLLGLSYVWRTTARQESRAFRKVCAIPLIRAISKWLLLFGFEHSQFKASVNKWDGKQQNGRWTKDVLGNARLKKSTKIHSVGAARLMQCGQTCTLMPNRKPRISPIVASRPGE